LTFHESGVRLSPIKPEFGTRKRGGNVTTRLWIKLVVVLAVLLFMVMMGMSNGAKVDFQLKPLGIEWSDVPSAIMYFIFFGAGIVIGAVLVVGPGRASKGK